jgi:ABC-type uncharacterized transport system substrate-binding protein
MRKLFKALPVSIALVLPLGLALAKEPVKIDKVVKHPNLDAAQRLASEALTKLEGAQNANEYDMDGHAQKALELLRSANDEIKLAAESTSKSAPPSKRAPPDKASAQK